MIVKHLRYFSKPYATLVVIGDKVGISFCHQTDRFDKKTGVRIATGRAEKGVEVDIPGGKIYHTKVTRSKFDHGETATTNITTSANIKDLIKIELEKINKK